MGHQRKRDETYVAVFRVVHVDPIHLLLRTRANVAQELAPNENGGLHAKCHENIRRWSRVASSAQHDASCVPVLLVHMELCCHTQPAPRGAAFFPPFNIGQVIPIPYTLLRLCCLPLSTVIIKHPPCPMLCPPLFCASLLHRSMLRLRTLCIARSLVESSFELESREAARQTLHVKSKTATSCGQRAFWMTTTAKDLAHSSTHLGAVMGRTASVVRSFANPSDPQQPMMGQSDGRRSVLDHPPPRGSSTVFVLHRLYATMDALLSVLTLGPLATTAAVGRRATIPPGGILTLTTSSSRKQLPADAAGGMSAACTSAVLRIYFWHWRKMSDQCVQQLNHVTLALQLSGFRDMLLAQSLEHSTISRAGGRQNEWVKRVTTYAWGRWQRYCLLQKATQYRDMSRLTDRSSCWVSRHRSLLKSFSLWKSETFHFNQKLALKMEWTQIILLLIRNLFSKHLHDRRRQCLHRWRIMVDNGKRRDLTLRFACDTRVICLRWPSSSHG